MIALVTHLLRERPSFVKAVDRVAAVAAVLPQPKSADREAVRAVGPSYSVDSLSREQFADPDSAVAYLEQRAAGHPVVLLDVGGNFAGVPGLTSRYPPHVWVVTNTSKRAAISR